MARSLNQVTIMGNLTRDPEVRQTTNNQSVCSFSLALNRSYQDKAGEWQEATDYVDCVAWAGLGERVGQYLSKGRRCLVTGRLQSRSWEQDGQKRSKLEVLASDVTFLDGRGGEEGEGGGNYGSSNNGGSAAKPAANKPANNDAAIQDIGSEPINLDDIPF
jgi:single-strand DNA-binding protein